MWYCPRCVIWVGSKLDECNHGHEQPRRPLRSADVGKPAFEVTLGDRLKAKVGWYA
jgi:hypothetical protein